MGRLKGNLVLLYPLIASKGLPEGLETISGLRVGKEPSSFGLGYHVSVKNLALRLPALLGPGNTATATTMFRSIGPKVSSKL